MIGGGAGSGKSSALLAASAAASANPKHRAVIFRRDMPSLRHLISSSYALFVPLGAGYNKSEHTWRFSSGSTLEFAHLEDDAAVFQHSGKEYSFIGFYELTQLPGDATDSRGQPINSSFSFMMSRLRAAKDSNLRLEIRCAATPGGPGMGWVKAYFRISDSGESTEFVHEKTGLRIAYFKATVRDNPALSDTDYEKQLLDLPAAQRKALLHGDWSAFVGQVFTEYSYALHTCDPFPIPDSWEVWRGCDDGYASPAACYWLTRDPTYDRVYVIGEVYERGLTAFELGRAVVEMDARFRPEERLQGSIDSAAFADTGEGSRADFMNKPPLCCKWTPCAKGSGSRVAGWQLIHDRLSMKPDGRPGLVIFRDCKHLIRTLPSATYATRGNVEDVAEGCETHGIDALRYGLAHKMSRFQRIRVGGI
jgi:hypothetical protein